MTTTFSGTFECKGNFWTYDFFLPLALIVNGSGSIVLSCPEAVIDISNPTDHCLWKDDARVEKEEDRERTLITVFIRRGEWQKAASFSKEIDEI